MSTKKKSGETSLIIVESPTKAKTISKFVGSEFRVESSYGHVRDLPKSKLGIDTENNFEPHYIIPIKSRKQVTALKKLAAKAKKIILATDEDREGEAIAWHLITALGLEERKNDISRIAFHEITEHAIKEALKNPRPIDEGLINAQQARRVLDRLVGYLLSPFLWKKVLRGLSAGRVQSTALRLIVEREEEIKKFKPDEYWSIHATLARKKKVSETFEATVSKINGEAIPKLGIGKEKNAKQIVKELENANFFVASVETRTVKRNPPTPFTTSTLQQEGAKRLRLSARNTMRIAQRLYENGHITYMRTDSVNLSNDALQAARKLISSDFGKEYLLPEPRRFTTKSRLAQEAHEAIRPTNPLATPDSLTFEEKREGELYELIWRRFIGSQLPQATFSAMTVTVTATPSKKIGSSYELTANGNALIFDGFLKVWQQKFEEHTLPTLEKSEELTAKEIIPTQHFTEPPPRYNEASLVKALEQFGIGRPSTYAPIISVIQDRNYVQKNETRRFEPTEIGTLVNRVLTEHFPEVVDIQFTARMEEELDAVAEGGKDWHGLIREFYEPFSKNLAVKYEEVKKEEFVQNEKTDEVCEKCGKPMVIKTGRFGKFLACSGFPECKSTKSLAGGGFGKNDSKSFGVCSQCNEGAVAMKRTKRGRFFYGCSRYPDCDFATWKRPEVKEEIEE